MESDQSQRETMAIEMIGWKSSGGRNYWYDGECKPATQPKNDARLKTVPKEKE